MKSKGKGKAVQAADSDSEDDAFQELVQATAKAKGRKRGAASKAEGTSIYSLATTWLCWVFMCHALVYGIQCNVAAFIVCHVHMATLHWTMHGPRRTMLPHVFK